MRVRVSLLSAVSSLALFATACGGDPAGGKTDEADSDTDTDTDTDTDSDTDSDTDTDTDTDVTDCGVELTPATDGVCTVVGTGADGLLLRGDVLLEDRALRGGSVVVDDRGDIVCAACDCSDAAGERTLTQVDCAEGVISPGLINPHDHIGYTEGWPIDTGTTRYDHRHDWRGSLRTPSNSDSNNGRRLGELRHLIGGTTSMVGSGHQDGMVRNLDRSSGLEGLPITPVENQTFPLGDSNESYRSNCGWNYADDEQAISRFAAYIPHVAEGIDSYAADEFACQSRPDGDAIDATEPNTSHVHAVGLSTEDYYVMARDGAGVVWSPRSNIALYGVTAQVTSFDRFGGIVSLGTDWTYSGSVNLNRELACADHLNQNYWEGYFSDRELWLMVTRNGAHATGTSDLLGTLEAGKVADIAVFDGREAELYRAVIEAGGAGASLVLRGGEVLYGEADVVGAIDGSCETVDACGQSMALCSSREWGQSYSDVMGAIPSAYPAFFCDAAPTDEPTCDPYRPGEFTGRQSGDEDGDGIGDSEDNCPTVFNPIRPIDGGVQPDADGDGLGDLCDETPLEQDLDGDNVDNDDDNCPFDANADQLDSDGDDKGDACDPCPTFANPDTVCPEVVNAYSIEDVRTAVGLGERILIVGSVVTGVGDSGFTMQDPSDADGRYAGIYVYTGGAPTVAVGDVIDVTGEVGDYYGEGQLQSADIVLSSTVVGTVTPVRLTTAEAATEPYEGVLVTLTDATVTDPAYDCSVDGSCSDAGLWEIGGSSGVVAFDRLYEDSDWSDRIGNTPVTGVMGYRWERRRIMPRSASDLPN